MIRGFTFTFVLLVALAFGVLAGEVKEICKKKPEGNPMDCCSMPLKDIDKTLKCLVEQKGDKDAGCSSSCFFPGIEIVKDGKIDRPTLLTAVKDWFTGTDKGFESLHDKAIDHCIAIYDKMIDHPSAGKKPICDRSKSAIVWCLHGYYFMNCPATVWTESAECSAEKKYATECSGIYHGHHGRKPAE